MNSHYLETELYQLIKDDSSIFKFLQESTLDDIWYWDLENPSHEWMSKNFWKTLGYNSQDMPHSPSAWQNIIFKEDLEKALDNFNKHLVNPEHKYDQIVRYQHANGSTVWIRCRGIIIRDDKGEATRMLGAHNDVTEIMNLKQHSEQKESFLQTLIDSIPIPIFYKNNDGIYLEVNHAWEKLTGIEKKEIEGKKIETLFEEKEAFICTEHDRTILLKEEENLQYETKIENLKNNTFHDVIFYKSAHFNEKNEVIGVIGSIIDLTQLKQLQDEHKKQEKMLLIQSKVAAIGEMLSNITHQWRQPLNIISSIATGTRLTIELEGVNKEEVIPKLNQINAQVQYLSQTIDDFRKFFKSDVHEIHSFNIKDTFNKLSTLTKDSFINSYIQYDTTIDDLTINGNENILIQALINIYNNAKDAMVSNIKDNKKRIFKANCFKKNQYIVIELQDSGEGIKEDILEKIFEPYFTTKDENIGTGIGLYMTNQIITKQFNGHIEVKNSKFNYKNSEFRGAKFTIYLPKN